MSAYQRRLPAPTDPRSPSLALPALTSRQMECLRLVQAGKTSPEIAEILGLSFRTVDAYVAAACQRLGVRSRAQAVACLARRGLLGEA